MAEILSSVQDHVEKTFSFFQMQLVQDLSETNQTRIFLNRMKLSSLYRS